MKKKAPIVIAFLVLAFLWISYPLTNKLSQKSNLAGEPNPSNIQGTRDIPEFENDYDWIETVFHPTDDGSYSIFWSNKKQGDESEFGSIKTSGTLYSITFTNEDEEYYQLYDYLEEYFKKLSDAGWEFRKEYPDLEFSGIAADGVLGSSYGYIKITDGKIRQVAYSKHSTVQGWEGPGSQTYCPCTRSIELFIGDPVNISDHLPNTPISLFQSVE